MMLAEHLSSAEWKRSAAEELKYVRRGFGEVGASLLSFAPGSLTAGFFLASE